MKKILLMFIMFFSINAFAEIDDSLYKNITSNNGNNSYTDLIEPLASLIGTSIRCDKNNIEEEKYHDCYYRYLQNKTGWKVNSLLSIYKYSDSDSLTTISFLNKSNQVNVTKTFQIEITHNKDKVYGVRLYSLYSMEPPLGDKIKKEENDGHTIFIENYLHKNGWKLTNKISYFFSGNAIYQKGNVELDTWTTFGYPLIIDIKRTDLIDLNKNLKLIEAQRERESVESSKEIAKKKFE